MQDELSITRGIVIEGGHYDTEVEVADVAPGDDSAIAVTISQAGDAPGQNEPDVIALSWSEWAAVEDHVSTVQAIYHNPDRGTSEYGQDCDHGPTIADEVAARAAAAPKATFIGFGGSPSVGGGGGVMSGGITVVGIGGSAGGASGGWSKGLNYCAARNTDDERCGLPDGHEPVRWRSGAGAGATSQHVAGHVTPGGALFWAGA